MKTHDALGRRLALAGRQPTGKTLRPTEAKHRVLAALARHGPLPAPILYEFGTTSGYDNFRKMLRDMYHEQSVHGGAYLERPFLTHRRSHRDARVLALDFQPAVYDVTEAGRRALAAHGPDYTPTINGSLVHQLMTAAITASMELAARRTGCRYLSAHEILADERCPDATRQSSNPLSISVDGSNITPDALFGIVYPNGSKRRFALEVDRGTESHRRSNKIHNTFKRKLDCYPRVYERNLHQRRWGIPRFAVLTVTTSEERLRNMQQHITGRPDLFLFKADQRLGKFWEVPGVMPEMLITPWHTAGGLLDISTP